MGDCGSGSGCDYVNCNTCNNMFLALISTSNIVFSRACDGCEKRRFRVKETKYVN